MYQILRRSEIMIGERLLDLRKDADLTQDELAAILKINKHSISAYEREKSEPPDDIKIEIAKFFHVSIDYLLGLTDNSTPYNEKYYFLKVPAYLPDSAKTCLVEYVEFLKYKYKKINNEKGRT